MFTVSRTTANKSLSAKRSVPTASGRISYVEQGSGPVALFVHGVLLNSHLWRHQLADLSDIRRSIAVDLLAHGDTEIAPNQDVSVTANAKMLRGAGLFQSQPFQRCIPRGLRPLSFRIQAVGIESLTPFAANHAKADHPTTQNAS